ncbi:hypothetical protein ACWDD9_43065 [Kitasatospora sp. NPDC001119]
MLHQGRFGSAVIPWYVGLASSSTTSAQLRRTGGLLCLIAAEAVVVELTELHRFSDKAEADATVRIRVGDGSGLDSTSPTSGSSGARELP